MDIGKLLKKVSNLNEYISVTQEVAKQIECSKMQFNLSTVLSLKKVRALEIEYFNKCEGKGAALIIFEKIVNLPPSKTWEFLGKELVFMLQYWLDAMRKHLVKHNHNWWNFMILLLKFVKLIRLKDQSIPNILVDHTAECLFDLSTTTEPDVLQRLEILCCLNLCCADASRDIRNTLKVRFEAFFTKLANRLATCCHLPTQFSILETLLRWLLPRHDPAVRHEAAIKWFPEDLFGWKAVQLFLERPWQYFFQDARDFLNAFNEKADIVVSVLCRKILIGSVVVVSNTEKRETWLDVNTIDNSISILLDPRILDALGIATDSWDTLIIAEENIQDIQLNRDSSEMTLSLHTSHVPMLLSSGARVGDGCDLKAVIGTKGIDRLDKVLRSKFALRYKTSLDLDKMSYSMSPVDNTEKKIVLTEEDTRFSHPAKTQKRKRSGYMVRSKNPPCKSPSTASTSSLAHLHEKLALLPRYKFEKEAVQVCALPNLSTVTEISETDDRQSVISTSTIKITRPYGVCQKNNKNKSSQSDSEVQGKPKFGRYLSPIAHDNENSTSCLLVATIGSADESVINDTLERITKSKDYQGDNIVDLLVQEALRNERDKLVDSGINTGDSKKTHNPNPTNTETLDNNNIDIKNKQDCHKTCTVISNTTTDTSNDVVDDTPLNFVNIGRRQKFFEKGVLKENLNEHPVFNVEVVENFFTQHITENNRGEIVISPTLARKINETSSESEQFDDCVLNPDNNIQEIEIQDIDIIECLNSIVDIVCSDFEKCTKMLDKDCNELMSVGDNEYSQLFKDTTNIEKSTTQSSEKRDSKDGQPKKGIRLRYSSKKIIKPRVNSKKRKNKPAVDVATKMSPIAETKDEGDEIFAKILSTPESKKYSTTSDSLDMPLTRRKRKLYSPKEENCDVQNLTKISSDVEEDNEFKASKAIHKYTATSYKDIAKDRAKHVKRPRTRRSRTKSERTPSPKTKKLNDMFDNLKDKVESNDSVILANKKTEKDLAVYNITSDSEDEDFKKKKLELRKRISSTTIVSGDSSMSMRRGRTVTRINYSENKSSDETIEKNVSKPRKTTKRKKQTKIKPIKKGSDLIDEKMRKQAQDELNTSFIVEKHAQSPKGEPKLVLKERPELEIIHDEPVIKMKELNETEKRVRKNKKIDALSLRKEKCNITESEANGNRTESPLPGLVIETMPTNIDDGNDSISINMMQKLNKIYQDGFETSCNNETNTTHNLLSDIEMANQRLPQIYENNELNRIENYATLNIDDGLENELAAKCSKGSQSNIDTSVIDLEKTNIFNRQKLNKLEKNKTQTSNQETVEVIEIPEISEIKSDKSIATVGKFPIRAHGDSNEAPPDSESLRQKLKPRDLEVEYLEESIKDYYNKLTKEIQDLPSSRAVLNDSGRLKSISSKSKSPVVSIARLSIGDISKWLPSKRDSDTGSSITVEKSSSKKIDSPENEFNVFSKLSQKKKQAKEKKLKNSGLEIQDDSSEISRKRKSKRLEHKNVQYVETDSENSDSGNVIKPLDVSVHKKVSENKGQNSSVSDDNETNVTKYSLSRRRTETKLTLPVKIERTLKKSKKGSSVPQSQMYRKSIISPVKMFDEIYPSSRLDSTNKSSNRKEKENDVSFYRKSKDNTQTSSPDSKMSTSTRIIEPKPVSFKKKSGSPEISVVKRIKLDDSVVTLPESGPSVSSVNDWFRRNAPASRVDQSMNTSITETMQNVMEKLDTTLEEIHQSTTKKFIHMFVDAQKELALVRQKRRQVFRAVASEVMTEVVKIIDSKFADLDHRSREMDLEFLEQLKVQASSFIREDCKKKRLMINLLKEDIQAVLDHVDKKKSRRS